jgi:formate hydrogenlyase subunit 4
MLRQPGVLEVVLGWLLAVVLYPGLAFGVGLSLVGEWLFSVLNPLFARRIYRLHARPRQFAQPVHDIAKLAARRAADAGSRHSSGSAFPLWDVPQFIAPVLALALMPLPGSPITTAAGPVGDVFLVLALLAIQPLFGALARFRVGDLLAVMSGMRAIGRLITGLIPALVAVAALVQAAGGRSLVLVDLTAAPETGGQALARLLAGAALLVALPWWLAPGDGIETGSASGYAGSLLERTALATFWSILVLPMPGDLPWWLFVTLAGALFAFVAMHVIQSRVAPTLRRADAARLAWTAALPIAALALLAAVVA